MIKENLQAYLQKAYKLREENNLKDAKKIYNLMLAEIPAFPDAYYGLYRVELLEKNTKEAKKHLQNAVFALIVTAKINPHHKKMFDAFSDEYIKVFNENLFLELHQQNSNFSLTLKTLFDKKEYKKIYSIYTQTKSFDVDSLKIFFITLKNMGFGHEITLLAYNLLYYTDDKELYVEIAKFFKDIKLYFVAIKIYGYLIQFEQKFEYFYALSVLAVLVDDKERVEEFLQKALSIKKDKDAVFLMGSLYAENGEYDKLRVLLDNIKDEYKNEYEDFISLHLELGLEFREDIDKEMIYTDILKSIFYMHIALNSGHIDKAKEIFKEIDTRHGYTSIKSKYKSKLKPMMKRLDNIVSFHTVGRGGSFFFHSLIDGHKEVATIPGVYLKGYFEPSVFKSLISSSKKEMVYKFLDLYEAMIDWKSAKDVPGSPLSGRVLLGFGSGLSTLGENRDQAIQFNKDKFAKKMLEYLENFQVINEADFFKVFHLVFEEFRGHDVLKKKTLFYHIHNPSFIEYYKYLKSFPKARDLFIIRNWLQGFESWANSDIPLEENRKIIASWKPEERLKEFKRVYTRIMGKLNSRLFISRTQLFVSYDTTYVKLEDVKNTPEATMRAVAKFMGVTYDECLVKAEFMGLKFNSNSSKLNPTISGFDKASIKRKVGVLFSHSDAVLLNTVLRPWNETFEYEEGEFKYVSVEEALAMNENIMDWERKLMDFFEISEEDALKSIKYRKQKLALALNTQEQVYEELKKVKLIKPEGGDE